MSNAQSIDSLRELNAKLLDEIAELRKKFAEIEGENAEIPELRRKVAEVEAENAKLRQIIEENARRDVRVKELEQKNTELEARLAIVEQSSVAVSKNDKEAIVKQSAPSSCIYSNVEIKVEAESTEKCFAEDSSSDDNLLSIPDYSQRKQDQSLPSCVSDQKSSVDREMDTFLDDAHKKSVSDGIRRRNKEKLLRETASLKVLPSAENNLTVFSGNDKIESSTKTVSSGNDQMVSEKLEKIEKTSRNQQKVIQDFDDSDEIEITKNQNIELDLIRDLQSGSIIASPSEISEQYSSSCEASYGQITTKSLIHLFRNATRAGHEEILSWVHYSDNFENKVVEIRRETGVTDKTARTQIYKEMLEHLAGVTPVALRIKTLRAKKIRKLFGENGVGIDKIKCVNCSANEISKLTNEQIQNVIDQVTSKTVSSGNDQSHVPLKTTNGDASSKLKVNVSTTSRPPIPRTTYDRSYFRNKTLGQYPTLYREFSSENFDYYGITDETSCDPKRTCPLCSLDHDDEESIEGRYKAGSYFIKCEQREIEIVA